MRAINKEGQIGHILKARMALPHLQNQLSGGLTGLQFGPTGNIQVEARIPFHHGLGHGVNVTNTIWATDKGRRNSPGPKVVTFFIEFMESIKESPEDQMAMLHCLTGWQVRDTVPMLDMLAGPPHARPQDLVVLETGGRAARHIFRCAV